MKTLLTLAAVTMLNCACLYPFLYLGTGRRVSWMLVAALAAGGIGCMYLLVRYRREL